MSNKNIDKTRLKRDYIKNPLIKGKGSSPSEKPYKEDLEYLYIELNLSKIELGKYLNLPPTSLSKVLSFYNIKKDKNKILKNMKQTLMEKYGVENISFLQETKDKISSKIKEKSETIVKKIKQTKLERYGDENYNNNIQQKQTCLERYGTKNPSQLKIIKDKVKQTKLERYGDENYINIEKMKQTLMEKYGVDNISKTQYFKNAYKQTMLEKYGVEHYSQTNDYKIKFKRTLKKNGKCRGSDEENIIYQKILQFYPDVLRWYSNDERYPFECDFYIPSLDTFIEYQGDWYHGKKPYNEPYDSENKHHNDMLNKWKLKDEEFISKGFKRNKYARAIKIWTIKDPLKRQTALKNNLNYIEIFDINDIDTILEGLKNVKK